RFTTDRRSKFSRRIASSSLRILRNSAVNKVIPRKPRLVFRVIRGTRDCSPEFGGRAVRVCHCALFHAIHAARIPERHHNTREIFPCAPPCAIWASVADPCSSARDPATRAADTGIQKIPATRGWLRTIRINSCTPLHRKRHASGAIGKKYLISIFQGQSR